MAQYFLAAINSTPAPETEESIAWELAKIERKCNILNRLEPLGRMNYSGVYPCDNNHCDLVEIARLCIQLEKYGKLEEVKELLVSIKHELSAKDTLIAADFARSEKLLEQASRGRFKAAAELEKIFSDKEKGHQ